MILVIAVLKLLKVAFSVVIRIVVFGFGGLVIFGSTGLYFGSIIGLVLGLRK